MTKLFGTLLLLIGMAGGLMAIPTPEIDPGSSVSSLVLLSGALLVIRAGARK